MGQTPSRDKQVTDLYSSYIQQQQNLINQQQYQINDLYQMNMDTSQSQQMPPNIGFQQNQQNQQQYQQQYQQNQQNQQNQQYQQNQQQYQQPQLETEPKIRLDPYKLLNISKQYDENILKKAYLKAAMKYHPDRGGSPAQFQKVSIAYTLLKQKLKDNNNNNSHSDLRKNADSYFQEQQNQPKVNIKMNDNFDIDVFNNIYNENKIKDVYDEGYSSWMNSNDSIENENTKLFQNGFNKDLFNSTFEKYKQTKANQNSQQMVQFNEPEVLISMKNQDSLMTLGSGKIMNFGGSLDNLSMTDYKQAFTDGSMLIDTSTVDINDRANSINGIKSQRSNISYNMSREDQQRAGMRQHNDKKEEQQRLQRLNVYDQNHKQSYEKIHSMLLR